MCMSKVISFLLPRTGEVPIGGFKVVYEYANRLVNDGYDVNIIYGIASRPLFNRWIKFGYYFLRFFRWMKYSIFKNYQPTTWFQTDKRVNHILTYSLSEHYAPRSDYFVATSWSSAFWLDSYRAIDNKNKFYLIQHFEDWHGSTDLVLKTWKMKMNKIVIAPWLQDIADNLNEESFLVENGFDQNFFYITIPIENRNQFSAIMLWHDHEFKACHVGLQALYLVKEKYPQFKAIFFGVPDKPKDLPEWIEYYQMPSAELHRDIYNRSAIFVGPSSKEGFCLTPPEAMLCGCAVACTNIGGYTVVAKNGETALLSEVNDAFKLSENIITLIENQQLRIKIASNGNALVKKFTWERAYSKFISVIECKSI